MQKSSLNSISRIINKHGTQERKDQNKIAENVGNFDVLLLGPQVRHLQRKVKATVGDSAPVAVIDALAYGRCNGAAILKQAEDLVNNG